MQCCNPRIIPVESPDGLVTFSFQRCGKCYACRCAARGEMVVRMRHEMEDNYNLSKYFITLTYDDKHLLTPFNDKEWRLLSWWYHEQPIAYRRYDYSLLDPWRLSKFIVDLSSDFNVTYCHGAVDKHKNIIRNEENTHLRYFCTGEYGDISHRAHYHGCILFPREIHHEDAVNLIRRNWVDSDGVSIGCSNIQPIATIGACNYVAKHQVKECIGSEFQQMVAPVFARYCIYGGGLGRIMKNDIVMKNRYFNFLKTRNREGLYYTAYEKGRSFKIAIPRFLIKAWHPDPFSTDELLLSQKDGLENLMQFVFANLTENLYLSDEFKDAFNFLDWQFRNYRECMQFSKDREAYNSDLTQLEAYNTVLFHVSKPLKEADEQRKKAYINKHITAKLDAIAGGASEQNIIY